VFGIWRTLLAVEVVVSHILFVPILGGYAVFSFFVLSGYLMTSIMHETYGYTRAGFVRYLQNRALRLYPNYWFAILVSLLVIGWIGNDTAVRHFAAFALPTTPAEWFQNLTMIFPYLVPSDARSILAPPTWALTVEICFYILIGLGVSRSKRATMAWFVASILYLIVVRQFHADNRYSYAAIAAGSLPFSVGALTWHYRTRLRELLIRLRARDPRILIVGRWLVFLLALLLLWKTGWPIVTMGALWINIALSCLIVTALAHANAATPMRHFDKRVGDFSYPLYLLHMQIGVVASVLLFGARMPRLRSVEGVAILALTLMLTGLLTLVCARVIDPAVERQRSRIRQDAAAASAA
jgi:peptidoglycan/LPS O-acetylase OafA/YrhL